MTDDAQQPATGGEEAEDQHQLVMQKIYLKDASFESPSAPQVFTREWNPRVDVDLSTQVEGLDETNYQVVLQVTVTARQEDETAFLAEVQQAGVFTIEGLDDNERGHALGAYCPAALFPFAREAVADLVAKGGFPQLLLAPVNFDALYADHLERQQTEQGDGGTRH
ncbi:MAG TPA: protein-export chaperone SecB [Gammaproteobacteria bacterium]|nr:protein-export chaperone SecB [Gammaproteobacteria bacterium]